MVDETRYIPVKVLRQGNIYYLNCEAFDIVEKSSNLLHCIEQMKNRIIEKVVALHHAGEKLPVFDLYKSLKSGGILLEIPSSCFDDTLERVTLTLPKSVITGIDAVSPNRSAKFTQLAKEFIDGDNK
ncbi:MULTISPECIES: hypothetical protein [Gammaproteobacteria]|jgi:hypothetical protein|uniref:Uncharacterized protein n=10 Tax=Acinetobacter baumannii TaxID=470 RepID=X2FIS4_ACIBA|nr:MULTISPECIES: hypothetical protein [Gammaproteobacteria]ADX94334.1 hypothetical protein ABTW07_2p041 [Acinetobacter baumannii TCDC-AB0715]AHX67289.1 hypothetical protein B856_18805 [Acinetobacter baumannii AC30]AZN69849.1 hypothetical protein DX910_17385 [Acinetobacter haemolyticus]ADX05421.1 Putative uncharacterized protein [Acinetobacter baumannii 1656-2]AHM95310.1 hypothetical protein [Acinetobacter baumannii]